MDWKCPDCGLDYGTLHPPFAINTLKSFPRRFTEALESASASEDADAVLHARPEPAVWSAIEYTAHVADGLDTFAVVIDRMNSEDKPTIGFWDPDERAESQGYNAKSKDTVLAEVKAGSDKLIAVAESVDSHSWTRTAEFPWGERDVLVMLQNALHEGVHHLKDIENVLKQVRSQA